MKELTDKERIKELTTALRKIREQLYDWAVESTEGGWSTHQVSAQEALARDIGVTIHKYGSSK